MSLRWDAFDEGSLKIASGRAEDGLLPVEPRDKAEWTFDVDAHVAAEARTIKIRALNEDGLGAVALVDWRE